jgi:hypothetical protein
VPWEGCEITEIEGGRREFHLAEARLSWIRIDDQTRLQFGKAELWIETPFSLARAGEIANLDPRNRAALGPLLSIYPDAAQEVGMAPDGTLTVVFESGATLSVPPDPNYESWHICGFDCPPGGFAT